MNELEQEVYDNRIAKLKAILNNWTDGVSCFVSDLSTEKENVLKAVDKIEEYIALPTKTNIPHVFSFVDYLEQHVNMIEKQMRL